ncbi:CaiB/BaiF CoA transferase family protein [Halococcus hamelinensis]|uniref:Crotonobetainyl-CoA:carnitine CoA-transferase /alpha-methylacyl-CoA racemase 2 n=1 Tax=Halococcus hamelinensis 100A6 TaxID=1132509 RepID=M0LUA5_9EURY|nr:CaiB/BaiF CoA-transferase family protein [Halococcus hamelinensis]EMA35685.1 crotonobetainyl-CoA:carnitine CoA-transferase /alpha-methylacyl-CoA racemase 2 [Halococcus hamelinensis 100A6]
MRLDGVRVLDLTRYLPGPYATQLLADAGADVIKIEDPTGDPARHLGFEPDSADGTLFDAVNRGKRSVALDLKSEAGTVAFLDLARDADVVIEGFRPGVADRLGVGYEAVSEEVPDVVYCSLSGYGATGPYETRAGHDLNYVAFAGLLDTNRASESEAPRIPGLQVGDMTGGLFAAFSITGALCSRALGNTGGEHLDVAITDVLLSVSQSLAPAAFGDEPPRPGETALAGALPWYGVYETADGEYLSLAALEPVFWERFCETVDRPDLAECHGTDDEPTRAALREELDALFADRTREEWEGLFAETDATVEPVRTLGEALSHPQTASRGLVERGSGPARIGFPARSSAPAEPGAGVPGHGEHTASVLREAGYGDGDLDRLREADAAVFGD